MNIVPDLLPWEPLFSLGIVGLIGTLFTVLVSVLRQRRIRRLRKIVLAIFAVAAVLPWIFVRNFGERLVTSSTTNRADTATGTPSDLAPRHYAASRRQVSDALLASLGQLGWELVAHDDASFRIEVPVARIGWFIDDMHVTLSEANGTTTVQAQSHSRVGRGDLGENRRHIVQLFTVLDKMIQH